MVGFLWFTAIISAFLFGYFFVAPFIRNVILSIKIYLLLKKVKSDVKKRGGDAELEESLDKAIDSSKALIRSNFEKDGE